MTGTHDKIVHFKILKDARERIIYGAAYYSIYYIDRYFRHNHLYYITPNDDRCLSQDYSWYSIVEYIYRFSR